MSTDSLFAKGTDASSTSPSLKLLNDVLSDYLRHKEKWLLGCLELVGGAIEDWITIRHGVTVSNHQEGTAFNPFSHLKIRETAHSRIIGDLLNPSGSHGQKTLFLEAFLRFLEIPDPDKGPWNISVETGRVVQADALEFINGVTVTQLYNLMTGELKHAA